MHNIKFDKFHCTFQIWARCTWCHGADLTFGTTVTLDTAEAVDLTVGVHIAGLGDSVRQ